MHTKMLFSSASSRVGRNISNEKVRNGMASPFFICNYPKSIVLVVKIMIRLLSVKGVLWESL